MSGASVTRSSIAWGAVWLACLASFLVLGVVVAHRDGPGIELDLAREVQKLPNAAGDALSIVNFLGGGWTLGALTAIGAGLFLLNGLKVEAVLLVATLVPRLVQEALKKVFDAPRPAIDMLHVREFPGDAAYPSGHVVGTTVVFVLLFFFTPALTQNKRLVRGLRAACIAMVVSIPYARIWNGAHWPSDCVGGYLFAALWLIPCLTWYEASRRKSASSPQTHKG